MHALQKRGEIIEVLGRAAHRGSLGLFLGTGFSIAATDKKAPNWKDLLSLVAKELFLDDPFKHPEKIVGRSLPEAATAMVNELADQMSSADVYRDFTRIEQEEYAQQQIKETAAQIVSELKPTQSFQDTFRPLLHALHPAWVVTTNYDDLFQQVHGKARTFLPNDVVVPTADLVPIWHIHGSILSPNTMVITQEDYVENLRPGTYRQAKLAHMMLESTTLMLGYGYGDVNVQNAASIAKSRELLGIREAVRPGDSLIVQMIHKKANASDRARSRRDGVVLIDSSGIDSLLEEVITEKKKQDAAKDHAKGALEKILSNAKAIAKICSKTPSKLVPIIKTVKDYPAAYYVTDIISFLGSLFEDIAASARANKGFEHYATWLDFCITMLLEWDLTEMPPTVFEMLSGQLAIVTRYIDPSGKKTLGNSWQAWEKWTSRKPELIARPDLIKALNSYARRSSSGSLKILLHKLNKEAKDQTN